MIGLGCGEECLPAAASVQRMYEYIETDLSNGMNFDDSSLVLRAAKDERAREEFILQNEKNILRIVSRAKHRFVTKSDDEWSIALCAFSHAIETYCEEKGRFLPYAETVIRRSLIDAYRAESKFENELPVSPGMFAGDSDEEGANPVLAVVTQESMRISDTTLRDEILSANAELKQFGFRFFDLTECSPNRDSTKAACLRATEAVLSREDYLRQLMRTKQLPVKRLIERYAIPKKVIERYRKYIIAMVIIRTGDYPMLKDYISNGRGNQI